MSSFANDLRERANRLILLPGLTGFLVVLGFYRPPSRPTMAQAQQVQVVELKAKKYEFDPSPVHVKAGTKVQLKIAAIDHDQPFGAKHRRRRPARARGGAVLL